MLLLLVDDDDDTTVCRRCWGKVKLVNFVMVVYRIFRPLLAFRSTIAGLLLLLDDLVRRFRIPAASCKSVVLEAVSTKSFNIC